MKTRKAKKPFEFPQQLSAEKAHPLLMERLNRRTPKELLQSLVDSGILTPSGSFRKRYGG